MKSFASFFGAGTLAANPIEDTAPIKNKDKQTISDFLIMNCLLADF